MSYGPLSVFTATMASAGTVTSSLDLARSWKKVHLEVPTMASGADIYIQASSDNSTFRRVQIFKDRQKSFSMSIASMATLTSAFDIGDGAYNAFIVIPCLTTGTSILVHGSLDNSAFQKVQFAPATGSASYDFSVATFAAGVTRLVPLPEGLRYFKIELATGMTQATSTYKVLATVPQEGGDFAIASNVSSRMVPIPNAFRYIKVETDVSVQDGNAFKVICSD